jgi:hypothetical protein
MLLTCRPATIFVFLSLAFGSIIIFANPPLRGPDEIAHFLRIYSYARGELLPVTEINARKGIFVNPRLYNQLYFFKSTVMAITKCSFWEKENPAGAQVTAGVPGPVAFV